MVRFIFRGNGCKVGRETETVRILVATLKPPLIHLESVGGGHFLFGEILRSLDFVTEVGVAVETTLCVQGAFQRNAIKKTFLRVQTGFFA